MAGRRLRTRTGSTDRTPGAGGKRQTPELRPHKSLQVPGQTRVPRGPVHRGPRTTAMRVPPGLQRLPGWAAPRRGPAVRSQQGEGAGERNSRSLSFSIRATGQHSRLGADAGADRPSPVWNAHEHSLSVCCRCSDGPLPHEPAAFHGTREFCCAPEASSLTCYAGASWGRLRSTCCCTSQFREAALWRLLHHSALRSFIRTPLLLLPTLLHPTEDPETAWGLPDTPGSVSNLQVTRLPAGSPWAHDTFTLQG